MTQQAGIYVFIDFEWPTPFEQAHAKLARRLHDAVQGQTWIREVVAASHGLGTGPSSSWVFWLENYGALERLLRTPDDAVCKAYTAFFEVMPLKEQKVREEVLFL
ncbi:MAG: hypothetical protein LCI00_22700 [Chloroflexi bacterium]|nr:hypothetical protein [Chloroflexota bacterium]MCC6895126.1 hypothetical protein [Anaerolineae bacterium]